jgi:hypothetical protein
LIRLPYGLRSLPRPKRPQPADASKLKPFGMTQTSKNAIFLHMQQELAAPDLCAYLDRLKALCDRLEEAQNDPKRYRQLVDLIRVETDSLRDTVCRISVKADS